MEEQRLFTDADGRDWTNDELQALVLQVGSFGIAATRLGKSPAELGPELRKRNVLTPADFVRKFAQKDITAFRDVIIREGQKGAAEFFNVSLTHLRKIMDEFGIKYRYETPTTEAAINALNKFGSPILAARLLHTTAAEVKKACPEWKDLRDPLKTGRQAVATGRTGEIYWSNIRGPKILQQLCLESSNYPGHDFIDLDYGKVNVKTANAVKTKRKQELTWTWECNPEQDADTFVLVALDLKRTPIGAVVLTRDENRRIQDSVHLGQSLRRAEWANGCFGFSYRSPNDRPESLILLEKTYHFENTTPEPTSEDQTLSMDVDVLTIEIPGDQNVYTDHNASGEKNEEIIEHVSNSSS